MVQHIVKQKEVHYLWQKGRTYYFVRRIPKDIQEHYSSSRVVICLKTHIRDKALRLSRSFAQRLEDYWLSLRLSKIDVPAVYLLRDKPLTTSTTQSLSEALELYLRLKGTGKDKVFRRGVVRNISSVIQVLGDRPLDEYSTANAAS